MKTLSIKILIILSLACGSVVAQTNDALATQAYNALQADKIEEAITLCEKALQADPTNSKAVYVCGIANFQARRFPLAEKYLLSVEEVKKDDARLYAALGAAYYANRAQKNLLADLNTSLDYLAKSIALNPKSYNAYNYRSKFLLNFHGIGGLSSRPKLKDTFYSDLRMVMQIVPEDLISKFDFAKASTELGDFGQAIPVFTKLVVSPMITKAAADEVCGNAIRYVENADSEARLVKKVANPTLWSDGIALMKGCKNAAAKFETDETRKKEQVSKFREKIIYYHQEKAKRVKSDYLASPEYLAELTEAIDAGETKFYDKRIEVYTFRMQFAKANADKKSKEIADETSIIVKLIAEEKRLNQAEKDFANKNRNANGNLSFDNFKTDLATKKSRLVILDRIIALNIPQTDKDAFSQRRNQLAEIIEKSDAMVANAKSKEDENSRKTASNEREQNRDADNVERYNKEANEAATIYKKVGERSASIDDCRMLVNNYIKKCMVEKLEFNIRDLKNTLFYLREARKHANNMTSYETKRKYTEQADRLINTVENSLSINEKSLKEVQSK